jgi:hypothetical protein
MAEELGLGVNQQEFEDAQAASKEASKASSKKGSGDIVKLDVHDIAALERNVDVPKTEDSAKFSEFLHTGWYTLIEMSTCQILVISPPMSRHYITTKNSFHRPLKYLTARLSESSWIARASMPRPVDRNTTLEISLLTVSRISKLPMCKYSMDTSCTSDV